MAVREASGLRAVRESSNKGSLSQNDLSLLAQVVTTFCFRMASESTGYSRKRRLLRQAREVMREMEGILRMYHETGDTQVWLRHHAFMDEDSDAPDPEEELRAENERLRREARESRALVDAAAAMAESEVLRRDLERARMACEDVRSDFLSGRPWSCSPCSTSAADSGS